MKPSAALAALFLVFASLAAPELRAQERPIVVIDPGHGGSEVGVQVDGLLEKDLVLRIALAVGAEFVDAGWDRAVAWEDRRARAAEVGADALLMLHIFQADDPDARGAEVYFSEGEPASTRLAGEVADVLRAPESPVLLEPRPWPFLASPTVPTAMIELAHLTNREDRALLLDAAWHHEVGESLVDAVEAARGDAGEPEDLPPF